MSITSSNENNISVVKTIAAPKSSINEKLNHNKSDVSNHKR